MGKIFTNSRLQPVYYVIRKDETTGKMLYKRAPFDVVKINGALYVQPRNVGLSDQAITQFAKDSVEDKDNWRENDLAGYETLEPIILNENQVGDGSDSWIGLHKISTI